MRRQGCEGRTEEEGGRGQSTGPVFQKISHWRLVEWRWLQPEPKVLSNRLGGGLGSGSISGALEAAMESRAQKPPRVAGTQYAPQHEARPKQGFLNSARGESRDSVWAETLWDRPRTEYCCPQFLFGELSHRVGWVSQTRFVSRVARTCLGLTQTLHHLCQALGRLWGHPHSGLSSTTSNLVTWTTLESW